MSSGSRYFYRLDGGNECPDPASRFQPEGVHGPSEVTDPEAFAWTDDGWRDIPRSELVFYELHIGTFSDEGTFDGAIPHLDRLRDLGITCIEIMPVNQFPGARNWGYDGVQLFAAQNSYGGPDGLRRLVDACHARGFAVILDVVYNHLGPEGNYLGQFGPYFTDRHQTPWGAAINFDDRDSDEVQRFFMENALHWITDYHFDGFRLDAIHAIQDHRPRPFLRKMAHAVHAWGERERRFVHVIAESNMNDPRVVNPARFGGFGLDAEWNDDFHHALHTLLTDENTGYYHDYQGFSDLARAVREGFVYTGEHMAFRGRGHGDAPHLYEGDNFVIFAQNHDQIGNRAIGDRLSTMISFEAQKAVAGLVTLLPYLPLLFMGEEYGETSPFPYFVDHGDPALIDAVRRGRRREFKSFGWHGELPDPAAKETFEQAKLDRDKLSQPAHAALYDLYRELLGLRRQHPALSALSIRDMDLTTYHEERILFTRRRHATGDACCAFSFGDDAASCLVPIPGGNWRLAISSAEERWAGTGSNLPLRITSQGELTLTIPPNSCCVYIQEHQKAN